LKEFEKYSDERIFITSSLQYMDAFGRVCVRTSDFFHIRGYNERLSGYGYEDTDLFYRLLQSGLLQKTFLNETFSRGIQHSYLDRIVNEQRYRQLDSLYLSYESPCKIEFLIRYKEGMYESGKLINNRLCNFNHNKYFENMIELCNDNVSQIALDAPLVKEEWTLKNDEKITGNNPIYYKIEDEKIISEFLVRLSNANNFETAREIKNKQQGAVNPAGFGQGMVYKNFDYTNPIILD
jgi:hypothetical protein